MPSSAPLLPVSLPTATLSGSSPPPAEGAQLLLPLLEVSAKDTSLPSHPEKGAGLLLSRNEPSASFSSTFPGPPNPLACRCWPCESRSVGPGRLPRSSARCQWWEGTEVRPSCLAPPPPANTGCRAKPQQKTAPGKAVPEGALHPVMSPVARATSEKGRPEICVGRGLSESGFPVNKREISIHLGTK